jgi:hypothetical protein
VCEIPDTAGGGNTRKFLFTRTQDGSVGRRPNGEFSYEFHIDNIFRPVI